MATRYATPVAFKQALEQRLRSTSSTGIDFARRRQLLVFDRFLVRAVRIFGDRRQGSRATLRGDVAFADPILGEPDVVVAADHLGFAGVAPPTVRLYPVETHIDGHPSRTGRPG